MLRITFPTAQLQALIGRAQANLKRGLPDVLRAIGTQFLSFARRDYTTLSGGGATADGRQWKTLTREGIAARVRGRPAASQIVAQRRALARQIRDLKGPTAEARRKMLRRQRTELAARMESLVDAELARPQIGIDTGLQRASGQPGFVGPDGHGGNIFDVDPQAASVTIGYGRDYSEDFDSQRPLLPDIPPESWITAATSTVEIWADSLVREAFKS